MKSNDSKVSSPFGLAVPWAPTPARSCSSRGGIFQSKDSGRRCATKMNVLSSNSPKRVHSLPPHLSRANTGKKANHSPNADQNEVSFTKLRSLYEMTTVGLLWLSPAASLDGWPKGGDERCSNERRRGPRRSGKYTYFFESQLQND